MQERMAGLQDQLADMKAQYDEKEQSLVAERNSYMEKIQKMNERAAQAKQEAESAAKEREYELLLQSKDKEMELAERELHTKMEMKNMELAAARENMELRMRFEQQQAEYERQHAEQMRALEMAAKKMEEDLKNAEQKFTDDAGDPDKFDAIQDKIFQTFLSKVGTMEPPPKMDRPSVAVLGQNGVGKSSLINALAGKKVTEVGYVDCTKEVSKVFGSDTTDFYDVPGCNDRRSYCNLKHIMQIKTMHLILICYVDRVEHIIKLEEMVASCKVPYLVVRTKMDTVDAEADRHEMWNVEKKLLKGGLCYVSSRKGDGMDHLRETAKAVSEVQL